MCLKKLHQTIFGLHWQRRPASRFLTAIVALVLVSATWIENQVHGQSSSDRNADGNTIQYPFIIHVPNRLIDFSSSDIHQVTEVDTCILGIRNVGSADIRATERSTFIESNGHARVQVRLKGEVEARTKGKRGPITIHNRCRMKFDFVVPIRIDEIDGFAAGKPDGTVTRLESNKILSTPLPGIRGGLAKRIAGRRMQETEELANRISLENTKEELTRHIAHRVAKQVSEANRKWAMLRSALEHPAIESEIPIVKFASREGQLAILVAESSGTQDLSLASTYSPTDLPPVSEDTIVQISVHKDWVHRHFTPNMVIGYLANTPLFMTAALKLSSQFDITPSAHPSWYSLSIRLSTE